MLRRSLLLTPLLAAPGLAAPLLAAPSLARAQGFPARPVRLVVPFAA
ncbi:MAG: tripartite tricarboxylate transporter substrate binding protein, partial [Acetobacteraceae bacterium]